MRQNNWQSCFEQRTGAFYDVFVHLTRTIALCLKQEQIKSLQPENEELSAAFISIELYSKEERDVLFHIMGAHHQRFVHKDRVLNLTKKTVQTLNRAQITKKTEKELLQGHIICPEKNDAHLQLVLNKLAINSLIEKLVSQNILKVNLRKTANDNAKGVQEIEESKQDSLNEECDYDSSFDEVIDPLNRQNSLNQWKNFEIDLFKGHVLKLMILQLNSQETRFDSLLDVKQRRRFIDYLLQEAEGSLEHLSSRQLEQLRSNSADLASAQTVRYLEFVLNQYHSSQYDTHIIEVEEKAEEKVEPSVKEDGQSSKKKTCFIQKSQEFRAFVTQMKSQKTMKPSLEAHNQKNISHVIDEQKIQKASVPKKKKADYALAKASTLKKQDKKVPLKKVEKSSANKKRDLIKNLYASLTAKPTKEKSVITIMTAKVCDFIDFTGITLLEVVFGISLQISYIDKETLSKSVCIVQHRIDEINEKIEKQTELARIQMNEQSADQSSSFSVNFREEHQLAKFLLEKLENLFQIIEVEELDQKLASIDLNKVRNFFEEHSKLIPQKILAIQQGLFSQLANFKRKDFELNISQMLEQPIQVEDQKQAEDMFTFKQKAQNEIENFLTDTDITDVADSLKKQLAAKLLFEVFDPSKDIKLNDETSLDQQIVDSQNENSLKNVNQSNLVINMKLLTIILNHYGKTTAELLKNQNVGCIWECRFKPHIAKRLTLRKLQTEGEDAKIGDLNEGAQQEIHQVLQNVTFPTVPEIQRKLIDVLIFLKNNKGGDELVKRLIQGQIIDKSINNCLQNKQYSAAYLANTNALRPLTIAEGSFEQKMNQAVFDSILEEIAGMWFMFNQQQVHVRSILIKDDQTAQLREEVQNAQFTEGKWKMITNTKIEIIDSNSKRYLFALDDDHRKMVSLSIDDQHYMKRMMDPMQIVGSWNWCDDGDVRTDYLKINNKRGGASGGSLNTLWYIMPDYKIFIGRTGPADRYIFKIVDDNTLEMVEPQRIPPTRIRRIGEVPNRPRKILDQSQLVGNWNWCHDGINTNFPQILRADGTGLSEGQHQSVWKMEPDGMIFVGRQGAGDRHIFKIIDQNTLECIDPKRNPSTMLRRVGSVPKSALTLKEDKKQFKFKTSQLQVNSLVTQFLKETANQNIGFWKDILPQMLEMLLFMLSFNANKIKARLTFEQCQTILEYAVNNVKILAEIDLLQPLLKSPLIKIFTGVAAKNKQNTFVNLLQLLLVDMKVQQNQCFKKAVSLFGKQNAIARDIYDPVEVNLQDQVKEITDLRSLFTEDFSESLFIKKHFLEESKDSLKKIMHWGQQVNIDSQEEQKQDFRLIEFRNKPSAVFISSQPETAQGNQDIIVQIEHGVNLSYLNLFESKTLDSTSQNMKVKVNCGSSRMVKAIYPNEQQKTQNNFKFASIRDQMLQSINIDLDHQIQGGDGNEIYYWAKNYSEIYCQIGDVFIQILIPISILDLLLDGKNSDAKTKPNIVKIQKLDGQWLFFYNGGVYSDSKEFETLNIEGQKIADFCATKSTAFYVTENGKLYASGLTNLTENGIKENLLPLKQIESTLIEDQSFDLNTCKVKRCWIQANEPLNADKNACTGYVIIEVAIDKTHQVQFYSYGINQKGCLANGLDPSKKTEKFTQVIHEPDGFDQIFLSPNLATAVDRLGNLWVLGGQASFTDDLYFPNILEITNCPLRAQFFDILRMQYGETTFLLVKNILSSNEQIIVFLECINTEINQNYNLCYQISKKSDSNNSCDLKLVSFINQKIDDVAISKGVAMILLQKEKNFGESYSIQFLVEPNLEVIITDQNTEEYVQMVQPEWIQFLKDFKQALEGQLYSEVLDSINNYMYKQNMKIDAQVFKTFKVNEVELKGDMFSSPQAIKLGRVMIHVLLYFNQQQMILNDKKFDSLFAQDPMTFRIEGIPEPCRQWNIILASKKRFLVDKFLEDKFLNLIASLPTSDRGRIEISINRYLARRFSDSGKVDRGQGDTVFMQVMRKVKKEDKDFTSWRKNDFNSAVIRANFQHEGSIDAGGPYRECWEQMSIECNSGVLPLLIPTVNQRNYVGEMRESFVFNHESTSDEELEMFFMFGCWVGNSIRTGAPVNLSLHPIIWKQLVGQDVTSLRDLETSDYYSFKDLSLVKEAAQNYTTNDEFCAVVDRNFTISYGTDDNRRTIELCNDGFTRVVDLQNYQEFITLATKALLTKDALQMMHFQRGVYHVLSKVVMQSCSWKFAEIRACGNQTIDIEKLQKHTNFTSSLKNRKMGERNWYDVYWKVLSDFSEADKRLYLKFVTGRAKLPLNIEKQSYPHTVTGLSGNDATLPQAHICYNQIDVPPYTSEEVLRKRLLTAIQFCGEVDTDGTRHDDY